jgi:hypothetical protein
MGRIYNASPHERQRPWKGSITGSVFRVHSSSAARARNNVYPQSGPYVSNPSKKPRANEKAGRRTASGNEIFRRNPNNQQRAWKGNLQGGAIGSASASSPFLIRGKKNVYWGKFSKGEKPITKDITGRTLLKLNFHSPSIGGGSSDTVKHARGKPKAEGAFSGRARGFGTASRRGERAWSGDVSGHPIRKELPRTGDSRGIYLFNFRRSVSNRGERAGSALPARPPGIGASGIAEVLRKITGRKTQKGGGSVSKSWSNDHRPIDVRGPGLGASGLDKYRGRFQSGDLNPGFGQQGLGFSGNIRSRRPLRGGGSASGKYLNNNGRAVNVRAPGIGAIGMNKFRGNFRLRDLSPEITPQGGGFSGNIKLRRPLKGGGSISGKYLSNNGQPVDVRAPGIGALGMGKYQGNFRRGDLSPGFNLEGVGYSGKIKARRPLKGGGSISGKYLSNNGNPVGVRIPGIGAQGMGNYRGSIRRADLLPGFSHEGARYSGNIKASRPLKGGGSVSGRIWNNNYQPIQVRAGAPGFDRAARFRGNFLKDEITPEFGHQGYGFSGNIKAKRIQKGGGSISERIFNNHGQPIEVRAPGSATATASRFSGNMRAKRPEKGGGSISGTIWNNNGNPIDVRLPASNARANNYSGKIQLSGFRKNYVQNPNAFRESLKKKKPNSSVYLAGGLFVKEKQGVYKKNPRANDHALPGIGPKSGSVKASEYSHVMKMYWSYKHNPSSNRNSLEVIAPGKAYARINDYQGNLKMSKFTDRRFHPDAQFAHGSRDNVKEDRTLLINLKLLWAKLFRKNDTQPQVVKEKEHRPRYDKKEKDLWKALSD